jgi:protein-S-isoprenylcysteine O-methyltransferase Ste14
MASRILSLAYSIGLPSVLLGLIPWYLLRLSQPGKASFGLLFTVSGILLCLTGAALLFSGAYYLIRRGDGTPLPCDPPKRMVVSGPYAHIQHPMLAGLFLIVLGEACGFHSLPLGVYAAAVALFAHFFVTLQEEPHLTQCFGEDYTAYQAATPRWFPFPSSSVA